MSKQKYFNGLILWEGNSLIDGAKTVSIITGLITPSANPKTGPMLQNWVIRQDLHPHEAVNTGEDYSICGDCPLRLNDGKRLCYVNQMSMGAVYKSFRSGKYPFYDPNTHQHILFHRVAMYGLRIGAYGDPCSIPPQSVIPFFSELRAKKYVVTGYTRRWMMPANQVWRPLLMASCFSPAEVELARSMGWSTFRVRGAGDGLMDIETQCPSAIEAKGNKTDCAHCALCQGNQDGQKSIGIIAHGNNHSSSHWNNVFNPTTTSPRPGFSTALQPVVRCLDGTGSTVESFPEFCSTESGLGD